MATSAFLLYESAMVKTLGAQGVKLGLDRLRKRVAEIEPLDPSTLDLFDPRVAALQASLDDSYYKTFGGMTDRYTRYRRNIYWAADIPSFGGATPLHQYREDVQKGKGEALTMLGAAIALLEEELGEYQENEVIQPKLANGGMVFIGHGQSHQWRALKDFLKDRLKLDVEEFNSVPVAGTATAARLNEMLQHASFAFIIMTAEDEQPDGKKRARENVVHEVGLFQGRLGFERAIVLLEEGCGEFSNIHGLGQIRFPKGNIGAAFEEIRRVLEARLLKH
jgi:predicted nucleotide-binding protein